MKEWQQVLIMAFAFLTAAVTLIVIVTIDSPNSFYGFFLGPSAPSYTIYPARVMWEIAIGIFSLTMGVGLSILAFCVYWIHKKPGLPNRLPASEGEETCKQ
jgi:hypothetical protein